MLFWNGNDYQNDKFIYNYFIQNVLLLRKKHKTKNFLNHTSNKGIFCH